MPFDYYSRYISKFDLLWPKSIDYVKRYVSTTMKIGAVMFDRKRKLRWASNQAHRKIISLGWRLDD